jgi:hypothetical protein
VKEITLPVDAVVEAADGLRQARQIMRSFEALRANLVCDPAADSLRCLPATEIIARAEETLEAAVLAAAAEQGKSPEEVLENIAEEQRR